MSHAANVGAGTRHCKASFRGRPRKYESRHTEMLNLRTAYAYAGYCHIVKHL